MKDKVNNANSDLKCIGEPSLREIGELPALQKLSIGVASTIAVTHQLQALSNIRDLHMCVYGEPLAAASVLDIGALASLHKLSLSYFWGNAPLPSGLVTHSLLADLCLEGCRLSLGLYAFVHCVFCV